MTFLPIVHRELREAARRKSTFRIRRWTALLAIGMTFCGLVFVWAVGGRGGSGKPLFTLLTDYTFGLCLLAGVFLTATCLSEEKREGTLGLLFLTDLKGYDVVLGKFVARALNPFYSLLALLPLIGLPLVIGGVTGAEFWRMTLALANTLFFSLAAGMSVSAFARNPQSAMGSTFGLLILLVAGLPALDALGWSPSILPLWSHWTWVSPFYPFSCSVEPTYPARPDKYWGSLLASHFLGWFFICLASFVLPRLWQEGTRLSGAWNFVNRYLGSCRGNPATRAKRRAVLLPRNPVLWLIGDEPAFRWLAWGIVGLWGIAIFILGPLPARNGIWTFYGAWIGGFFLKMLFGFQACRFFVEARRSGALELLLCTPLRNSDILKGQWMALRRIFLWPLLVFLLLTFVPSIFAVQLALSGPGQSQIWMALLQVAQGFMTIGWIGLGLLADTFAVGWVGMRVGLTAKKPYLAPALTTLYALILPSLGICGLSLVVDLILILWAATGLHQDLRWMLARQYQRVARNTIVPSPRSSPALPPVLAK